MSDYKGLGEKVPMLIDYCLSLHNGTVTAKEASDFLQCQHKTAVRIFKRLDLMAYEFSTFAISVTYAENRFGESCITIKRK